MVSIDDLIVGNEYWWIHDGLKERVRLLAKPRSLIAQSSYAGDEEPSKHPGFDRSPYVTVLVHGQHESAFPDELFPIDDEELQ